MDDALAEAAGRRQHDRVTISLSGLEVRPFPYQQDMLDELDVERDVHDRHRNLVVAATGTGKTVVAALDYRRLCERTPADRPRLLFVAHREEILEQSLRTYREVLADANFGELYVGGARPERWRPRLRQRAVADRRTASTSIPPDAYDIVVIDEFHHAEAPTYRRLLDHLTPAGAARPHRHARADRRHRRPREFFDGRTAAELRLWDALGADLLCPFHYFAVADGTDLRQHQLEPWPLRRRRAVDRLHRQPSRGPRSSSQQLHDKVIDPGRDARARLLRERRPRRVHGPDVHARPASPRWRSAATTPAAERASAP